MSRVRGARGEDPTPKRRGVFAPRIRCVDKRGKAKKVYRTHEQAEAAGAGLVLSGAKTPTRLNVYPCAACGGFHLGNSSRRSG